LLLCTQNTAKKRSYSIQVKFFKIYVYIKKYLAFFIRSSYVTDVTEINYVTLTIITITDSGKIPAIYII